MGARLLGVATAAIDVSDGLSTDLGHLCEASGLAAEVDVDALPFGAGASLEQALHGGEDYELLFAARRRRYREGGVPGRVAGVKLTCIGRLVEPRRGRPRMVLVDGAGKRTRLEPGGWQHLVGE